MTKRIYTAVLLLVVAIVVPAEGATFFGPVPYLSRADIPAGLYLSAGPTELEDFEDGTLDSTIIASSGGVIPPGFEGLIDSVDADDGTIDGSGLNGHSWFAAGVKFTFPPGTIAAGVVWTDGAGEGVTFSAFGPGNVPLGVIGPFNGLGDGVFSGETAEDRFFGVRDADGVESIFITSQSGGMELDHVQFELASKQDYAMDWHSIGPAAQSAGGDFSLFASIGQPGAGQSSGGDYTLDAGMEEAPGEIVPGGVVIFDNSAGSSNGYEDATTVKWLAQKFCVGSHAYSLDWISLFLVSADINGPRQRSVRLQIYSNDPITGRPSVNIGPSMSLSGATNPISLPLNFTEAPVTWIPDSSLILAANQCYWAVLSTENGIVGMPATFTKATGDAAAFGRAVSEDAGATWAAPDNASSRKMLIRGTPVQPPVQDTIAIFDNTNGSDNGGFGVTATTWIAGRFCLGSQAYELDSLSMLLSNGSSTGQLEGSSMVRLQIYSNDPVSGKPSTSAGVIMNLSGLTNPITISTRMVKWTPATPFRLSANACYWAVLSRDEGGAIGPIASFTMPTGDAGALGVIRSVDGGATWQTPDTASNLKMLIEGTPVPTTSSPTPEVAADRSTPIPGGTGPFTSFPAAPSLSGDEAAFLGFGSEGQQGIYVRKRSAGISRIVDFNTPIPNGTGNFTSLGNDRGNIIVGGTPIGGDRGISIVGGNVLFQGRGSGAQEGIYLAPHATPTAPIRIADTSAAIPGGFGNFTGFPQNAFFDGNEVAFVGNGLSGQQGIYKVAAISPPQIGSPLRIVDQATAIPEGNGNFTEFPSAPVSSGSELFFIGNGDGGQQGLYKVPAISPAQVGSPLRIADTSTPIPGGTGNFVAFGSDQAHPVDPAASGDRVAFVGSGSAGQQGIYTVGVLASPESGPVRLADTSTAIPQGRGTFASFGAVSISDTDLAFLGHGKEGQTGIYDLSGGELVKVVAVGDKIGGKTIKDLNFSRAGLFGDPITFQASFTDGTDGIYTVNVPVPADFRITRIERVGNDLRLTVSSRAGRNYFVQTRDTLGANSWSDTDSPAVVGTGGAIQITLTNAVGFAQRFFRTIELLP